MQKTRFAGLTRLDPGEALSADNYAFQGIDRDTIDRLLELGARTHRHDAHPALLDPTAEPTVAIDSTGGAFPADTAVGFCYTLVDANGGETLPSDVVTATTDVGLEAPDDTPDADVDNAAGDLLAGTYYYGISFTDGQGGETTVGPAIQVDVDPGYANAQIVLTGMGTLADDSGAAGWRLYKASATGLLTFLAAGNTAVDMVTDDGHLCTDCTEIAPTANSTGGTNSLLLTLPASDDFIAAASGIRIYMAIDGDFTSPCFVEQLGIDAAGTSRRYNAFLVSQGAPPDVNTSTPGAAKIDPDTDLLDWNWRRPVNAYADLPAGDQGDVRVTLSDARLWVVLDAAGATGPAGWTQLKGDASGGEATGHEIMDEGTPLTNRGILDFVGDSVAVTDDEVGGRTVVTISGTGSGGGGSSYAGGFFADADEELEITLADQYTATLTIADDVVIGTATDYPELNLWLEHEFPGDLDLALVHPDGTEYPILLDGETFVGGANLGTGWGALQRAVISPYAPTKLNDQPYNPVARFLPGGEGNATSSWETMLGKSTAGDWKLRVKCLWAGEPGTVHAWGLNFTAGASAKPNEVPVLAAGELLFRDGSVYGAAKGGLFMRHRGDGPFNENYTLGSTAWPDTDYWYELAGAGTLTNTAGALVPSDLSEKQLTFAGFFNSARDERWVDDVYALMRFDIQAGHGADWGTLALGFLDEDGNYFGTQVGSAQSGLRLIRRGADGTETSGTSGAGAPPEGTVWLGIKRSGDTITAEEWRTDPAVAGNTPFRTRVLALALGSTDRDFYAHGISKPVRPWVRLTPAAAGGVTLLGGSNGLRLVNSQGGPEGNLDLWAWTTSVQSGVTNRIATLVASPVDQDQFLPTIDLSGDIPGTITGGTLKLALERDGRAHVTYYGTVTPSAGAITGYLSGVIPANWLQRTADGAWSTLAWGTTTDEGGLMQAVPVVISIVGGALYLSYNGAALTNPVSIVLETSWHPEDV